MVSRSHPFDIHHVIFDWSGTLCDDHILSHRATHQTLKHFSGRGIELSQYKRSFRLPVGAFYRSRGVRACVAEVERFYFDSFGRLHTAAALKEGAVELLRGLSRQGITASILSTVRQDLLEQALKRYGIARSVIQVTGSVYDKRKTIGIYLRRLRIPAARTLYLGDMSHDVAAANAAGVVSACVLNGYDPVEQLLRNKPRLVFPDLRAVGAFFKSLAHPWLPPCRAPARPLATVGALVFNAQREVFLVLTPKWGYTYGIPGGKIDKGEKARAAVIRELSEETGMRIRPGPIFLVQDCCDSQEFYLPGAHMLLLNYLATTRSRCFVLNEEAICGLWLKPHAALNLKLNKPTRVLLREYLKRRPCPSI